MTIKALSKAELISLLEIIAQLHSCESKQQFIQILEAIKNLTDFEYARCLFGDSDQYDRLKMKALNMVSAFPQEWEQRYNDEDYFLWDNIAYIAFTETGLKYWSDYTVLPNADSERNRRSRQIFAESASVGLKDGWIYSEAGSRTTERSILSFAGRNCKKAKRSETIIGHLAPHMCMAVKRLVQHQPPPQPPLTKREKEVLTWIATGKTAWEISHILNISRRTVEFHISNILQKLDATNSQQAVAIAISSGIISL